MLDPIELFERAATNAADLVARVTPDQRQLPTPCAEWNVDALVDHMAAGTGYLLGALAIDAASPIGDAASYRQAVARCVAALRSPSVLDRRCASPLGFEWSVAEAAAGTAMDQLVHTWDLAVAVGASRELDETAVDACVAMLLPHMPELGRAAGIVGPEVPVAADASAQDRLLGAMGRRP